MKAKNCVKLLDELLKESKEEQTEECIVTILSEKPKLKKRSLGSFECYYVDEDSIKARARAIDRQLFSPNRKVQTNLNLQRAILFVQKYGERLRNAKIKYWNDGNWRNRDEWGHYVFIGNERLVRVRDFDQSDLDYALSLYNLG